MLEEVLQQGRTLILLQQQILQSRNEEGELPAGINGRLPASTLQELQLINTEVSADKDTNVNLVGLRLLVYLLFVRNLLSSFKL